MSRRGALWSGVAVLLVAATLRLVSFGTMPPGLYHDEAYHGLDVEQMLDGHLSLYFPANNGREPLFIYLVALTVGSLGRSPFALRLAAFPVGLLTVAATMAAGRALFSRRVGILAGAVLAVMLWHVHLSRVGFRAVLLPLFIALVAWQVALAVKGPRVRGRHWVAAGVLYGISFYTYTAARFTPVALAAFGLYVLTVQRPIARAFHLWRGICLATLAVSAVVAPLLIYTLAHPGVVLGRPGQVSIFDPAINHGDLWGTLVTHILRTAGMFFVRGDRIWRHNVPWRPIFDPMLGAAFIIGLLIALRRARQNAATGFVVIWVATMSLPTLLAEDAPHFLRAVGVLPMAAFLPALGLDWLVGATRSRIVNLAPRVFHLIVFGLPLLFGLISTIHAYLVYAREPTAGYWFEQGAVALAGRINAFLGNGWDGERMLHGETTGRHVFLAPELWAEWEPQLRFLIARPETMTVRLEEDSVSNFRPAVPSLAVFTWPYRNWQKAWDLLPAPSEITIEKGPLSQGDRDPEPFTTYVAFFATRPDPPTPPMAHFSGGVALVDVEIAPLAGDDMRVQLQWQATAPLAEDYTVFVHYRRDGERIAQGDSRPANGYYPTTVWRVGDVINDSHDVKWVGKPLPGRDVLLIGFWQPESGSKLYLLDTAGNPVGDWIEVPVR